MSRIVKNGILYRESWNNIYQHINKTLKFELKSGYFSPMEMARIFRKSGLTMKYNVKYLFLPYEKIYSASHMVNLYRSLRIYKCMGNSTWCSCFKCHFYNNPQILHENVSECLGLDKNIVIDGGFYTKQQLENLFA